METFDQLPKQAQIKPGSSVRDKAGTGGFTSGIAKIGTPAHFKSVWEGSCAWEAVERQQVLEKLPQVEGEWGIKRGKNA